MGINSLTDYNRMPSFIYNFRKGMGRGLESLAEETHERVDRGFDSGRDAMGRPWEPLSPETIRQKGHSQILVEEEELRDSIQYEVDRDDLEVDFYSDNPVINYHEFGTETIPRRPILEPAGSFMENEIRDHMGESVDWAFRRSKLGGGQALSLGIEQSGGSLLGGVAGGLL